MHATRHSVSVTAGYVQTICRADTYQGMLIDSRGWFVLASFGVLQPPIDAMEIELQSRSASSPKLVDTYVAELLF
jgi:hypothetical protein